MGHVFHGAHTVYLHGAGADSVHGASTYKNTYPPPVFHAATADSMGWGDVAQIMHEMGGTTSSNAQYYLLITFNVNHLAGKYQPADALCQFYHIVCFLQNIRVIVTVFREW